MEIAHAGGMLGTDAGSGQAEKHAGSSVLSPAMSFPNVAVVGVLAYFTLGCLYMHRRIHRRVEAKTLLELALWRRL